MGKKYIFYVGGKDIATLPIVQNEFGVYFQYSTGGYYKPVLSEFDNGILPSGVKRYTDGSHAPYKNSLTRNPIDISVNAGLAVTSNVDVKIINGTLSDGSWTKTQIVGTNYMPAFVHTYKWAQIGSVVKAGNPICYIAPKSVTTFDPHCHIDEWNLESARIRNLILYGDFVMPSYNLLQKVKLTSLSNIRCLPDTNDKYDIGDAQAGSVCEILSTPALAGGYTFYFVRFGDICGYVFDKHFSSTSEAVTKSDGSKSDLTSLTETSLKLAEAVQKESDTQKALTAVKEQFEAFKTTTGASEEGYKKQIADLKKQLEESGEDSGEELTLETVPTKDLLGEMLRRLFGGK